MLELLNFPEERKNVCSFDDCIGIWVEVLASQRTAWDGILQLRSRIRCNAIQAFASVPFLRHCPRVSKIYYKAVLIRAKGANRTNAGLRVRVSHQGPQLSNTRV